MNKNVGRSIRNFLAILYAVGMVTFAGVFLFFVSGLFAQLGLAAEQRVVAVIDTGLDLSDPRFAGHLCASGHKDFTGSGLQDEHGHGTHVAGLIVQYAGDADYCLMILKYYLQSRTGRQNLEQQVEAIKYAIRAGAKVVNISGGGAESDESEYLAIRAARDVTFVVAAGNESQDIDVPYQGFYPASYLLDNLVRVGNVDASGQRSTYSNWGKRVRDFEVGDYVDSTLPGGKRGTMSGTSQATAIHTGKMLSGCKGGKSCQFKR